MATLKKTPTKGSLCWVARDKANKGYWYLLSFVKPYKRDDPDYWQKGGNCSLVIYARVWHRSGGLRLQPGDGPVRIRIKPGWWERV